MSRTVSRGRVSLLVVALIIATLAFFVSSTGRSASAHSTRPLANCNGTTNIIGEDWIGHDQQLSYFNHLINLHLLEVKAQVDNNGVYCSMDFAYVQWKCSDCFGQGDAPTLELREYDELGNQRGYANNGTASHADNVWHTLQTPLQLNCSAHTHHAQAKNQGAAPIANSNGWNTGDSPYC